MAGYSMAKKKSPGNRVFLWIYIGSMMIPMQVTLVPLYILVQKMRMVDTYWALILPFLGTPWAVFMVKQFMASLPSCRHPDVHRLLFFSEVFSQRDYGRCPEGIGPASRTVLRLL